MIDSPDTKSSPKSKPSETVEMEILRPCFVSDASVQFMPAKQSQQRKVEKGKTYTLTRADAKMLHERGFARIPWKDDRPEP